MRGLWEFFVAFSILYFFAINLYYTVMLLISFFAGRDRVREVDVTNFEIFNVSNLTPPVSILIPAFNEEAVIVNSVYAALALDYSEFEVIVINDRSTDRTLRFLIETFDMVGEFHPFRAVIPSMPVRRIYRSRKYDNLLVIDKENGGKADALNAGLNISKYPYICNTDADTIFERDALARIMRPVMLDPKRVVAVGGQVRVGNGFIVKDGVIIERRLPWQLLPLIQLMEYLRTFIGNRVGWSKINGMLLISGAFGCWQRHTLVSIGGFSTEVTGEDLEITMRIHRILRLRGEDYRILSLPDPVCWTEVPADLGTFQKQRNRWHRVLLESFAVHRTMMLNSFYGVPGMLGMPTYFFFEILGPFVELFSYAVVLLALAAGVIDVTLLITFLMFSIVYTTILNLVAIVIEDLNYQTYNLQEVIKLIIVGILDNIGYRQFTMFIRIVATFDWLGRVKSWGKMERKGFSARNVEVGGMLLEGEGAPEETIPGLPLPAEGEKALAENRQESASSVVPAVPAVPAVPVVPVPAVAPAGLPPVQKESNKWEAPPEIRAQASWQDMAMRIGVTILIFSVPYLLFVGLSKYVFSPALKVQAIITPDAVEYGAMPATMAMRVWNTGPFTEGAAFLVGVVDGVQEFEGKVQSIPPRSYVDLPVRITAKPGMHALTLVLYDAWRENVRTDSREGIRFRVTKKEGVGVTEHLPNDEGVQ